MYHTLVHNCQLLSSGNWIKKYFWVVVYNEEFDAHLNGYKTTWVSFEDYHQFWEK
jgi:hypothetical protein